MFDFAEQTKTMTAAEILNYYRNLYYAEPQVTERGIVANAINELLPNVAPVVHGEWMQNPYCKRIFYCSECGRQVEEDSYKPNPSEQFPYCHCGAKMDGKEATP